MKYGYNPNVSTLHYDENPNCCGITELGEFHVQREIVTEYSSVYLSLPAAARTLLEDVKANLHFGRGLVACTTLDSSGYVATNTVLKKAGFKIVSRFHNPASGNTVLVHHLILSPAKKK